MLISWPSPTRTMKRRMLFSSSSCSSSLFFISHLFTLCSILPLIHGQSGIYTVVAPKTIRPNSPYNVGVSIDSTAPVKVNVFLTATLSTRGLSTNEERIVEPGTSLTITLTVGDLIDGGTYNLTVRGTGGINFVNSSELTYDSKSASVIIQTDKPIYKPGEIVKFRILLLDRLLRPNGPGPITVFFKDGAGNVITQWEKAIVQNGIFASELQLSDEPNLGDWSINVGFKNQNEVQVFTVAQYILPKFNVELSLPSFATFTDSKIVARIRATYVYGKPVKGEAVVSAYPSIHSTYIQPVFDGISHSRKTVAIDGVVDVEFDLTKELALTDDFQRPVTIDVVITENLTGRTQNSSKTIIVHKYAYKMEIIKGQESFKPGLPYSLLIKIATQDDVPISDPSPTALTVKHGYSYNHDEYKKTTYSIPPNGLVTLTFSSPANNSIVALGMEATYKELTEWFPTIQRAISPSNTYLAATIASSNIKVNEVIEVRVKATVPFMSLNYLLLGRGDLIVTQKMNLRTPEMETTLRIQISQKAAPKATLIVYMVHENEVVADSVQFDVGGAVENFLIINVPEEVQPGKDVNILLESKPNSLIGLKGIDQSVLLLKEDKDINMNAINRELNAWSFDKEKNGGRYKRSLFGSIGSTTAAQIFEDSGVVIMTNALVQNQTPAVFYRANFLDDASINPEADAESSNLNFQDSPQRTRKYFPETFIWEELTAGYDGKTILKKTVPDSITSWMISGFSLDSVYGLGVADAPTKLRAFRPFFLSLNVPYSVVKGEAIGVQVLVHNYMDREVVADVTLDNSNNQFRFTNDENEIEESTKLELFKTEKVTVKRNSVGSAIFIITPTKLGPIDLTIKATGRNAGDSITKPLLVKPPGQNQKLNTAALIDLRTVRTTSVNLTTKFPAKRVEEADSVKISVVGDILGPAITNLDKLLELPTGCGEQNMVHFVPDIIVLEYLQSTRQINEPVRTKALKFLETGYQRQLSYKHEDGSFSAFGSADDSGSTFLTAFVARAFMAARKHIYIETAIIEKALEWLITKQNRDGSFIEVGKLFDAGIQGGVSSEMALTAYVSLAFAEANKESALSIGSSASFSSAMNLALDYLGKNLGGIDDSYTLAIIAYALEITNHPLKEQAFNLLERLAKSSEELGHKYWERPKTGLDEKNPWTADYTKPITVETTAYALMTYINKNLFGDSLPVLRWLLAQRNEKGGFISSQDTVVGLTGLAKFAGTIQSGRSEMSLEITHDGSKTVTTQNFQINPNNAVVLQEIMLPPSTKWVNINAVGIGVAIVQLSWSYNLNVTGSWPLFIVDPQIERRISDKNQYTVSVCTRTVGNDSSNMAVMELNVPSGYIVNTDGLPNLLRYPQIKRYDTDQAGSQVIVYFESLNRSEVCPTVSAYRVFPIAKQVPAYVSVYDYYDNSRRARQFYSPPAAKLCDICEEAQCTDECRFARQKDEQNSKTNNNRPKDLSGAMISLPQFSTILISFIVVISTKLLC